MYNNNYILGLDIGISSVGWGLVLLNQDNEPCRIIDTGSRIFPPGEDKSGKSKAEDRRLKRGAMRITRRREFRVDRVRHLLYESGFLNRKINSNIVSSMNEELTSIYKDMIDKYYKQNKVNPYILKVKALDEKLTEEELCIILVHYAKRRGYKSNRESNTDDKSTDNKKVLSAIRENEKILEEKKYRSLSEMFIKDEKFKTRIRNTTDEYKISYTREMLENEIEKVLDKQISFGLITEDFKNKYMDIWGSQRHYSKGPGYFYVYEVKDNEKVRVKHLSPYGGNLIEKMVGKCFDGNPRAPKMAFSSELFVALTKLVNLRYKSNSKSDYVALNEKQIKELIEKAKSKSVVTYSDAVKIIGEENVVFKGLSLNKKGYKDVIDELKKLLNVEDVIIKELGEEDRKLYNNIYSKHLYKDTLIKLNGYHELRKSITNCFGKDEWEKVCNDYQLLDTLALFCTNYKINEDIKEAIKANSIFEDKYSDDNFIKSLPNFKDHLMLSTEIIRKLIPIMESGIRYDEAMEKIGCNHTAPNENLEKSDLLPPILASEAIMNQRVVRSLTQTRKVINAIIKKYGMPKIINIETARELAKSKDERRKIEQAQKGRQVDNEKTKNRLVELGLFDSTDRISSNDLLKYKLWTEQNELCAYSLRKISIEDLFQNNIVQIDHILPYSRTFNDNYLNKTLVYTSENQDKLNRTPYEWFGKSEKWDKFENFINSLSISQKKKDNYLLKNLDYDLEKEMREQNLNDTKYISTALSAFIKGHLNVEKVNVYQGALTGKLRARWGLNRLTHSYVSENYYLRDENKEGILKDRDNHLHHALDALVIACITPKLQQDVTYYEKYKSYIDGKTANMLNELGVRKEILDDEVYYINDETGEVLNENFKRYYNERKNEGKVNFKRNVAKLEFPLPYNFFEDEAKIRVYERNLDEMVRKLKSLPQYEFADVSDLHVLMPSIAKPKISGAMHEETYYGIKKDDNGNFKYKTIRKSVLNIKRDDIENIVERNGGSKEIYNTLIKWFGTSQTGADAFKNNNNQYPINPIDKEKKPIKKIKLQYDYNNTGHIVNGANVEGGNIYKICILKNKDKSDDKLYMVGFDLYDIAKINSFNKKRNDKDDKLETVKNESIDMNVKIEWAQKKYFIIPYQEMMLNYKTILTLEKGDLIKITQKNGLSTIAYLSGGSNGQIEVKSVIGDGEDLCTEDNIFNESACKKANPRFFVTISTLSKIEKLNINILGEIDGL